MNDALPVLPFWKARSTYALLLLMLSTFLNLFGVDLYKTTCDAVGACNQAQVLALYDKVAVTLAAIWEAAQPIVPILAGLWLWIERRAPMFRIGWGRKE